MTISYSIFFPIVPGISDMCDGCDPRNFIGYCFDKENLGHEFTVQYTVLKGYEGTMITSPDRDFIWSIQDLTDHGHMMITDEYRQELIDINSWSEEDQFYYEYRLILEKLNEGLN